ncbi:response regulator transcription factor [Acidobacteria bacterium AB60]|nr:response regulator transcription factor [Acidobacteria bacterium AB60]
MQILIIEDERKLAQAIATGLEETGYAATVVHTGEDGLQLLEDKSFDLILLDVMLPRTGGLEMLREMRRNGVKTPVLILTSRASVDDRVRGLDCGADDYLVKPFAFPELLARVRALQRRANPNSPSVLQVDDLRMDTRGRSVTRGPMPIELTVREYELLEYLMVHHGTVISREMLARDVWKTNVRYTSLDNVIDVHIARIRRKIDDPFALKLLHTVRGVGFILRGEQEA